MHAFVESDIALLDAEHRRIESAAEQRRELIALPDVEIGHVFVAVETMLGKDLFHHKGCDGGDAGGGDLLAFKFFGAGDLRAGDQPLKNPIVGRDNDF